MWERLWQSGIGSWGPSRRCQVQLDKGMAEPQNNPYGSQIALPDKPQLALLLRKSGTEPGPCSSPSPGSCLAQGAELMTTFQLPRVQQGSQRSARETESAEALELVL